MEAFDALDRSSEPLAERGFGANTLLGSRFFKTPHLVADANKEHRLTGVLKQVNNTVLLVFQENGFAVGEQVEAGVRRQNVPKATTHLALQESKNTADLLQREALSAKLGNHGDLDHFFRKVDALMALVPGRDDFTLIPPLQLAKAHLGDLRDVGTCICPLASG